MERSSYHPPTALINEEGPFSTLPQEHSKDQHHLINELVGGNVWEDEACTGFGGEF